jgi:hypothetical protein
MIFEAFDSFFQMLARSTDREPSISGVRLPLQKDTHPVTRRAGRHGIYA